jgi:hypothetical protein
LDTLIARMATVRRLGDPPLVISFFWEEAPSVGNPVANKPSRYLLWRLSNMTATQGAKEAIWVRRLLTEIGRISLTSHDSRLLGTRQRTHSDGYQGALDLAKNPQFHDKTKHIDIQQHWIREVLEAKKITLEYVPTAEQITDIFTKPLARDAFEKFRWALGLRKDLE